MRPGVEVVISDQSPPVSAPVATDLYLVAGLTQKGAPGSPQIVTSMRAFQSAFGDRVPYGLTYDGLDTYFSESAARAVVSRVVGPAAAGATATLGTTLEITATPGDWANGYTATSVAAVGPPATTQVTLKDASGTIVAQSPQAQTIDQLVAWGDTLADFDVAATGPTLPTAATTPLAGGDDDRAAISDDDWQAALDALTDDFGPGQVGAPGATSETLHAMLAEHADDHNRLALCDGSDTSVDATIASEALALRALGSVARRALLVAPWARIAGIAGGAQREVPFSCALAGIIARNTVTGPAGQAAAGIVYGRSLSVLSLKQDFASVRDTLNEAGVLLARSVYGQVCAYGLRSCADPVTDSLWLDYPGTRVVMAIDAQANAIGERYVFALLDGKRQTIGAFGGELAAVCNAYWRDGSLFGATAPDAYRVDVGPAVNTIETIAAGELHAVIRVRTSPGAELVRIDIVKRAITEEVAA